MFIIWLLQSLLAALLFGLSAESTGFNEQLLLKPLPQGSLLASFNFDNAISQSDFDERNYQLFPRSLAQILQHAHVRELHLRFTTGRWDEEVWGKRTVKDGGTGVEIWAWIEAESLESKALQKRWSTLVNSISGLFCASVQNVDSSRVVTPREAFQPQSIYVPGSNPKLQLLHGMLPNEVVCTENLTPFMKLLPCKGKAGISSLFDGHRIFDANWQNMAVDVRTVCSGPDHECRLELQQSVNMVLDIERSQRPLDDPLPRPIPQSSMNCHPDKPYNGYGDTCFPMPPPTFPAFNISSVYGHAIKGSCPLISSEALEQYAVCVEPASTQAVTANTTGTYTSTTPLDAPKQTCYALPISSDFDLHLSSQEAMLPADSSLIPSPRVTVSRTMTGRGQERGGIRAVLTNLSPTLPIGLIYLETHPWFLRPYMHTLRAEVHLSDGSAHLEGQEPAHPIQDFHYLPAIDRKRATHLELVLNVPAASTLVLRYEFEKSVLRYTEYPPDANRGFDIPAAIVRVLPQFGGTASSLQGNGSTNGGDGAGDVVNGAKEEDYVRTTTLLLYLMTPDFSMPYNVIILSSTVIALGFGSVFNLLVRRFVSKEEAEWVAQRGLLGKARAKAREMAGRIKTALREARAGKAKGE